MAAAWLAGAGAAGACTIPVFRYALDRWEADPFELALPETVAADTGVANLLRPLRASGVANLRFLTDISIAEPELRTARQGGQVVWSGALGEESLGLLLDSPGRRELTARILAGESVVWVVAHDGSETGEVERISKRLAFLQQVAALPLQDPNDPDSRLGPGPPLLLKFTVLPLRRDEPAEAVLLRMLAGPGTGIDPGTTSFAAAVFGRGRVLGAWPLAETDDAVLEEASLFLVGRCSCRVKDQNPGWDLLMNVDWDARLAAAAAAIEADAADAPPAEATADVAPVEIQTDPAPAALAPTSGVANDGSQSSGGRALWPLGLAAILVLLAAALLLPKRRG
jgi:hypothetical protein